MIINLYTTIQWLRNNNSSPLLSTDHPTASTPHQAPSKTGYTLVPRSNRRHFVFPAQTLSAPSPNVRQPATTRPPKRRRQFLPLRTRGSTPKKEGAHLKKPPPTKGRCTPRAFILRARKLERRKSVHSRCHCAQRFGCGKCYSLKRIYGGGDAATWLQRGQRRKDTRTETWGNRTATFRRVEGESGARVGRRWRGSGMPRDVARGAIRYFRRCVTGGAAAAAAAATASTLPVSTPCPSIPRVGTSTKPGAVCDRVATPPPHSFRIDEPFVNRTDSPPPLYRPLYRRSFNLSFRCFRIDRRRRCRGAPSILAGSDGIRGGEGVKWALHERRRQRHLRGRRRRLCGCPFDECGTAPSNISWNPRIMIGWRE